MAVVMRMPILIPLLSVSLLLLFQNCGSNGMQAEVKSFIAVTEPQLISQMAFWNLAANSAAVEQPTELWGNQYTLFVALSSPPDGDVFVVNDGSKFGESAELSKSGNQLTLKISTTADNVTTQTWGGIEWRPNNLIFLLWNADLSKLALIFNGAVLTSDNSNPEQGAFIQRTLTTISTPINPVLEVIAYNRVLTSSELQGLAGYFINKYQEQLSFSGWNSVRFGADPNSGPRLSFAADVEPIFVTNHCYECHGSIS